MNVKVKLVNMNVKANHLSLRTPKAMRLKGDTGTHDPERNVPGRHFILLRLKLYYFI